MTEDDTFRVLAKVSWDHLTHMLEMGWAKHCAGHDFAEWSYIAFRIMQTHGWTYDEYRTETDRRYATGLV